ncbi:HAD-IA family hydrolase [Eubacteriaceae bacterium ES2]|nr:HAD-IA family hydrolase [Eubacteriaceae bacterium ES2]
MVKAVIFDLDDTLISEWDYIQSGFNAVSEFIKSEYKLNPETVYSLLFKLFEEDRQLVFNRLLSELDLNQSQAMVKNLTQIYRNHHPKINYFPDVLPALAELQQLNMRTGIITDGYYQAQHLKIEAIKAEQSFEAIIITDQWGREFWKPHPRSFQEMKSILQVEYDEMVYVGDNPAKDFYIGAVFPIRTIRILRDGIYNNQTYFKDVKETEQIDSLTELKNVLIRFNDQD